MTLFSTFKPRPGYVYILYHDGGEYKIGHTESDLRTRITLLGSKFREPFWYAGAIPSECPKLLERRLHDRFRNKYLGKEWFFLSPEEEDYLLSLTPITARLLVPEASMWFTPEESVELYDRLQDRVGRTMQPSNVGGRLAEIMSRYWAMVPAESCSA